MYLAVVDISTLTQLFAEQGPLAIVAVILTFLVTKFVDFVIDRRSKAVDQNLIEGTTIRAELREEVVQLKQDIKELSEEVDIWREKYLEVRDDLGVTKVTLHAASEESRMLRQKLVEVVEVTEGQGIHLGVSIRPLIDSIEGSIVDGSDS